MAKKSRRREKLTAPNSEYRDSDGNVLVLRSSLTPATRAQYSEVFAGNRLSREDAWHRAVEFLFERLAVSWEISGVPIDRQRELLARFRVASTGERDWVRGALREHCTEHFPDIETP